MVRLMPYDFVADSFHTKKTVADFLLAKCENGPISLQINLLNILRLILGYLQEHS